MEPPPQRSGNVIVVDDLWADLGMVRPLASRTAPDTQMNFSRPWQLSIAAVVLTLMLHIFLGVGMFADFGGAKGQSSSIYDADRQAVQHEGGDVVSVLILLSEPDVSQTEAKQQSIRQPVVDATDTTVSETPPLPAPSPDSEGEATITSAATGPGAQPRTLDDIYKGQIKARIERAWSDSQGTRLAVGNCQVNIRQGTQGEVTNVDFGRCFATSTWKETLAQAIRYASPLPAPPDAKVFAEEVSLEF